MSDIDLTKLQEFIKSHFDRVEERFDQVDARFDHLEERLTEIEDATIALAARLTARIRKLER